MKTDHFNAHDGCKNAKGAPFFLSAVCQGLACKIGSLRLNGCKPGCSPIGSRNHTQKVAHTSHTESECSCQFDNMPPYLCGSVMKNVCVRDRQCPTEGHVGCGYASSIVSGGEQNLSAALQAQSAHVLAQHPYCNVMAVYVCGVKMVVRMRPRLWDG